MCFKGLMRLIKIGIEFIWKRLGGREVIVYNFFRLMGSKMRKRKYSSLGRFSFSEG